MRLLVVDGAHLRPTDAGRALLAAVGAETAPISARIWGGIPAEDLAAMRPRPDPRHGARQRGAGGADGADDLTVSPWPHPMCGG